MSEKTGRIAVHSTHEAAVKLGGIGTVLHGVLGADAYRAAFPRSLLVGVYPFTANESVIDDPAARERAGWRVLFDSDSPPGAGDAVLGDALGEELLAVAQRFAIRLVFGERRLGGDTIVPALIASPEGIRREAVEMYRGGVRHQLGIDLTEYDDYPAITDRVERRLERRLDPEHGRPDEPEYLVLDHQGRPLPGGAAWVNGRASFPPIPALDAFSGIPRANKYLLELQFHTFAAPALWQAARRILAAWAPAGGGYDRDEVTLFAHDWLGVPLAWAMLVAGDRVGRSVYFAHESRIFRLLAEGSLSDADFILRRVCHREGHDAALYPYLARAVEAGWDLEAMFPGSRGFTDIFHHRINREARRFDRIVAVGPWVQEETKVSLRPHGREDVALVPNGIPSAKVDLDEVAAARERLREVAVRNLGFRPDVVFTGIMRCELSKAPWRNIGLFDCFARTHPDLSAVFFWLSAPKPPPTRAEARRRADAYGWPLHHQAGPEGDLRPDEEALWNGASLLNQQYEGRAAMVYVNQFGWSPDLLGALDVEGSSFVDLRTGSDVEVGLSIYEPFGIAPLEPFSSGAVCVLSDACGSAQHLADLGLADHIVVGRFTDHAYDPREVDAQTLKRIESRVYESLVAEIDTRLGLSDWPAEDKAQQQRWREGRGERLESAQAVVDQLSWQEAVKGHLLPAVE